MYLLKLISGISTKGGAYEKIGGKLIISFRVLIKIIKIILA